jgi:catechol 2,3-dioxygenase-like lactoylglutathione lyase family enzyme
MYDHISLKVKNFPQSRRFYQSALEPLGCALQSQDESNAGFGPGATTALWISAGAPVSSGVHIAFAAPSRRAVDAFHAAALAAGGRDNGRPGLRENYGPTYSAAFAYDPDGNNIEAVCLAKK